MIPLINEGYPVLVAKTFSKIHGFAGLRVGYILGDKDTIYQLYRHSNRMYGLAGPTLKAAMTSYKDEEFQQYCRKKNKEARDYTFKALQDMGKKPVPSHTSFMVFPIDLEPKDFLQRLRKQGVGVRSWTFADQHWCRVSIGTMDEMKSFIKALQNI